MQSSRFALVFGFIFALLVSFSAEAGGGFFRSFVGTQHGGRQQRAYRTELRVQRQRTKDSRISAMGRSMSEIRQQRRDARRFGFGFNM